VWSNTNTQCDGEPEWNALGHTNSYGYSYSYSYSYGYGYSYSCTVGDTVVSTGADPVRHPDDHDGQLSLVQQWGGP
jgi:hypothetical protein